MMAKFFFFTDPDQLDPQTPEQAFGPVTNTDPAYENGKDKYRITSVHTTTAAPAVAVCDGLLAVQPVYQRDTLGNIVKDGNGDPVTESFTIIIKPNYQPPFDFPYVKYYLYKGITPSSIVNGQSVEFAHASTIPFIDRIDQSWIDPIPGRPPQPNPKSESRQVLGLDYVAGSLFTLKNDPTPQLLFEDSDPIDRLFYYPNQDYQLPVVKAGEKIGEFANTFGFEIVLERLGYEPPLALARTEANYITVDSLPPGLISPMMPPTSYTGTKRKPVSITSIPALFTVLLRKGRFSTEMRRLANLR